VGEPRAGLLDAPVQRAEINRAIFGLGGNLRRGRFAKMDRIDFIQRQHLLRRLAQQPRVLAVTRRDRFERRRLVAHPLPAPHQPAGKARLAHARVGAGDEE